MENLDDTFKLKGDVTITKSSPDGRQEVYFYPNLVVSAGKSFICDRMSANTTNIMSHMAVGTDNTPVVAGDTNLGSHLANVSLSVTGGTPSSNTVTYAATFGAGTGTGALVEAGIFNSANTFSGTMLCRTVFPVVNKGAADVVGISWVINII